ncbi:hypothetical protein [Psychrobacter sp. KH172YL61]|nr:hypothetical protein [Psychrobacter sp. KH172YL61]
MAALLVTYDLNSPGQKHAKVLEKSKALEVGLDFPSQVTQSPLP